VAFGYSYDFILDGTGIGINVNFSHRSTVIGLCGKETKRGNSMA
jgi:hypothetical protein